MVLLLSCPENQCFTYRSKALVPNFQDLKGGSTHHFQTFTRSSRDPVTTVSVFCFLFVPQATDQMASSWARMESASFKVSMHTTPKFNVIKQS